MNRLIESQTVEATEFVVLDDRAVSRARFEMAGHSPQMVAGQSSIGISNQMGYQLSTLLDMF